MYCRVKASASALAHGGNCGQGKLPQGRFARGIRYPATLGQCVLHVKRMLFPKTCTWILSMADPTCTLERDPDSSADDFPSTVAETDDCQNALVQKLWPKISSMLNKCSLALWMDAAAKRYQLAVAYYLVNYACPILKRFER